MARTGAQTAGALTGLALAGLVVLCPVSANAQDAPADMQLAGPPIQPQECPQQALPNALSPNALPVDPAPLGPLFSDLDQPADLAPVADCIVRPPAPDLFGKVAVPVRVKAPVAEWYRLAGPSLDGVQGPWTTLFQPTGAKAGWPDPLLVAVNRWVNGYVRYIDDANGDHWASAAQTLRYRIGDCEDFAIAKMALLQRAGVSVDDMFLIVVRQMQSRGDHAVLAVRREGVTYILDNRTDRVLADRQVADYQPVLGYSGPFTWVYGRQMANGAGPVRSADTAPATGYLAK